MAEEGLHKIQALRKRWIVYQIAADVVLAFAIGFFAGAAGYYLLLLPMILGVVFMALALTVLLFLHKPWLFTDKDIASYLNAQYPDLEESTDLLLHGGQVNTLQSLARTKAETALLNLKVSDGRFARRLKVNLLILAVSIIAVIAMTKLPKHYQKADFWSNGKEQSTPAGVDERVLPQVEGVTIVITPPAYTGKATRTQDRFNLTAEEGANAHWTIKTNVAVKKAYLIFNDKERLNLKATNNGTSSWSAGRTIDIPGFYQVSIDGKLSDLYQIQVVKDGPPVIHVKTPKPYTYIDAGEAQQVNINATLNDDYGIADALIIATVAKGRGEGVKFKEYKLTFNAAFGGHQPQYNLQKLVSLPALNMEPGDELYFYVQAQDTRRQQSRTDVFTVAIQDTAELLSMDGVLSGANLKPEFFRSERQIIIDAEQLLKEKDTLSTAKFNSRSNDLGVDQKLLRLRYGKFLGEEDETVEGPKGGDNLSSPEDFSNAEKILKEYTDDHDKADDAQFFEPAVKAQLKATLTEMWKAELQLRLYKPQAALPFAYKALRLLKDLQQKSRSFVAKTSYNPPPLKPEKRLSGELDKIIQPVTRQEIKVAEDRQAALKNALKVLEELKQRSFLNQTDLHILQSANQQLSEIASSQPGVYLPALSAIRKMISARKAALHDVNVVERAIQKTLSGSKTTPKAEEATNDMGLSKSYFKNLKRLSN